MTMKIPALTNINGSSALVLDIIKKENSDIVIIGNGITAGIMNEAEEAIAGFQ